MPNWCMNHIVLSHEDPVQLERAEKALKAGDFLNEFIPIPEELDGSVAPTQKGDEHNAKVRVESTGYPDWYSFCVSEWGTKWDVTAEDAYIEDEQLFANFDSAWGPPIQAMEKLVEMGFGVNLKYYEPGMGFVGEFDSDFGDASYGIDECPEELDEFWGITENMEDWNEDDIDETTEA